MRTTTTTTTTSGRATGTATAPALQVDRWLNGPGPASLDALRGRVVVLHAFQMLCPSPTGCRRRRGWRSCSIRTLSR